MRVLKLFAIFAAILALPLAGCKQAGEEGDSLYDNKLRYRLTMEVETPEGLRSGASVYELTYDDGGGSEWLSIGESRPSVRVKGEAVAVDLPGDRVLFLLMQERDVTPPYAFPHIWFGEERIDGRRLPILERKKPVAEIWPKAPDHEYVRTFRGYQHLREPFLVTFADISDPTSVEKVDPDNLTASFGGGYTLKSISVAITDEPVTTGIEKRLAWLGEHPEPTLDPKHGPKDFSLPATLKHGAFRKGVRK